MAQELQSGAAKGLIVVAIIAVLISLVGIMINLSFLSNVKTFAGKASQESGNATLIVQQVANINFTNNTLNWGTGQVDTAAQYAFLTSNFSGGGVGLHPSSGGASGGVSWTNLTRGLVLVNIGNANVSLTLQSDKGAFEFIGHSPGDPNTPWYKWWLNNDTADDAVGINAGEPGSCQGGGAALSPNPFTAFRDVSNNTAVFVCNNFSHLPIRNELEIDLSLRIQVGAPTGGKNSTLTATAAVLP